MIYAQIKNGILQNCIILEDESLKDMFSQEFDFLINLDGLDPCPGIGWNYDEQNFTPPSEGEEN